MERCLDANLDVEHRIGIHGIARQFLNLGSQTFLVLLLDRFPLLLEFWILCLVLKILLPLKGCRSVQTLPTLMLSRRPKLVFHSSLPRVEVRSSAKSGLQNANQRLSSSRDVSQSIETNPTEMLYRGVTPFVLFWNLSGQISKKSLKMVSLMISE